MVVFACGVVVEVVAPRLLDVVVVVAPGVVVDVVLLELDDVVVVLDDGVVDVLVVVEPAGDVVVVVVVPREEPPPRFVIVGPVSLLPKIAASGLPAISSIAVINRSASTKTTALVPAMAFQENFRPTSQPPPGLPSPFPDAEPEPVAPVPWATVGTGTVRASRRSVAGASAAAEISRRFVSSADAPTDCISVVCSDAGPTTSVGAASPAEPTDDDDDVAPPAASVPPKRRKSGDDVLSWTRTATCFTACWPRSIDCATSADPIVAAAEPMATPMIVPVTPKLDAMSAASTAPTDEARICR